eukprot:552194-Pleurochrysis_carterae.AAC.6
MLDTKACTFLRPNISTRYLVKAIIKTISTQAQASLLVASLGARSSKSSQLDPGCSGSSLSSPHLAARVTERVPHRISAAPIAFSVDLKWL